MTEEPWVSQLYNLHKLNGPQLIPGTGERSSFLVVAGHDRWRFLWRVPPDRACSPQTDNFLIVSLRYLIIVFPGVLPHG